MSSLIYHVLSYTPSAPFYVLNENNTSFDMSHGEMFTVGNFVVMVITQKTIFKGTHTVCKKLRQDQ